MKNLLWMFIFVLLLVPAGVQVHAQESEIKDTPWFSGMPNYAIYDGEDIEFDGYKFFNGKNCTTVEGKKFKRTYYLKEDAQKSSVIQIMRNYSNAIKSMGGTVIYEGWPQTAECAENNGLNMVVGKAVKGTDELWVEVVTLGGDDYYLIVVLKELMKQDVTASSMFEALNRDGHIALYINFDTGKSIIRDESKPIIEQIVQMMKANPDLKIGVEGHTDNVGTPASNKNLSEARAKSVVSAIVAQGVSADRLSPAGFGQDKPVADNGTEEGRAKNRRVELVKK
ncbi:MAG TPA: OmpA family protein [Bacteroidales bacterium]|nr:OmpA family protein [Bacteroidales bacterium]